MWDSGIQDSTALSIFGFCQPPTTNDGFKRKRPSRFLSTAFIYAGNDLLSHTVSRAVQSAQRGLTSVFGMGTGGTPAVRSPTSYRNCFERHPLLSRVRVPHPHTQKLLEYERPRSDCSLKSAELIFHN